MQMDKCHSFSLHSWKPRVSPLLALCVFLVCEQHRGEASDWLPYIDVLPMTYTCPAYFTDDVMAVLPTSVQRRALEQREAAREIHSSNRDFFRSVQQAGQCRKLFRLCVTGTRNNEPEFAWTQCKILLCVFAEIIRTKL